MSERRSWAGRVAMLCLSASQTSTRAVALGQGDELAVAGRALDQGRDRARPSAHQEVALPVAGDRSVLDLRRALGDHHHLGELALTLAL